MEARLKCIEVRMLNKFLYYGKRYIYPTQKTMLKWLKDSCGITISIRTLNRDLRKLEDQGRLPRTRRITREPGEGIKFRSTMYFMTKKMLKGLVRAGMTTWLVVKKALAFPKYPQKEDTAPKLIAPPIEDRITPEEVRALRLSKKPGLAPA